ncbi:MAG: hypothetical protein WAT66_02080 [Actinomycetota bacterium]
MRKLGLLFIGVVLALGVIAPANAAKPTRTQSANSSANAFWYFTDSPARNTVRNTVWYVGVFASNDGIWSDLYQDVETCVTRGHRTTCTYTSRYGFSDLSDGVFTIDADGLTVAHVEGTYNLETYDENGNLVSSDPTAIVADFEGIGEIFQNSGRSTYCDQFICFRTTFTDASRSAAATGTVNGADLGETYDAYLSSGASREVVREK